MRTVNCYDAFKRKVAAYLAEVQHHMSFGQRVFAAAVLSFVMSETIVSAMGLLLIGRITPDYLITGGVASIIVATLIVAGVLQLEKKSHRFSAEMKKSEQRLNFALGVAKMGVWELDLNSRSAYLSPDIYRILGVACISTDLADFKRLIHDQDAEPVLFAFDTALAEQTPYTAEYRVCLPDGRTCWIEDRGEFQFDEVTGKPLRVIGTLWDITARKLAEEELRLAALVYQNSNEAITVTDTDNHIIAINPAFSEMTGYSAEEVIGRTPKILSSGGQDSEFFREMWRSLNTTGIWQGEIWNRRKNGEKYVEWLTINTIYAEDGSVHRRVALFSDITKRKEADTLIWTQANYDLLTRLPNRRLFIDRLEQEIKKAQRDNAGIALLFIALDKFKEVNDALGHQKGDELLVQVAERIQCCVRASDTVARLGGDEFTVILRELSNSDDIAPVAQGLITRLGDYFQLGKDKAYISASIGITVYPEDGTSSEILLKNAYQAMYAAKQAGRNGFRFFTAAMQETAQLRTRLLNDLRQALQRNEFQLYYQPIVCLSSGVIHKAEALLRWKHPEHGFISPSVFISVAEDSGLIHDIGDWVFKEAAQQVKLWRERYHLDFQVSVNKSPAQFKGDRVTHRHWSEHLEMLGLPGQSIVIEITEGLLLNVEGGLKDKLSPFKSSGVQVAIDDFGTGYSSLAYLNKLDIDYLKIDQSFTRNLSPGSTDSALCEAIVVMAHKLGLLVIAEGVETEEQRALLAQMGCDYGQGYLFSKPLPVLEFEVFLAANQRELASDRLTA
jgi:diguanylate cyclase (GGDEF)-like protein/PAS domain S-box-containing protein